MSDVNLSELSLVQLRELQSRIEAAMPGAEARERAALMQQVEQLAKSRGLHARDVLSSAIKGRKLPPKYIDPTTGSTWSGRGMEPKWLRGVKNRDRFAVKDTVKA